MLDRFKTFATATADPAYRVATLSAVEESRTKLQKRLAE
jgi:hypothetical protein